MNTSKPSISTGTLAQLLGPKFVARLDTLDVVSRKILQGRLHGERRSKRRGQSVEFADHRPYVPGDDLRFVDWNVYGRLEQLFLKLFLEDQDLTVQLVVDASGSMTTGEPAKSRFVQQLAAALGYVSLAGNNRLTLSFFADGLVTQMPHMRGRNYVGRMADLLLTTPFEGASDFEKACRQIAAGRIGTGIVIVLSDFLFKAGYEAGLRQLMGRQYDLYAIQVLSPQEVDPPLGGDLRLIDIEDADESEITVSAALMAHYKRNLSAYCNELGQFCTRRGGVHILATSSDSVETLVLNYLRRVRLLR